MDDEKKRKIAIIGGSLLVVVLILFIILIVRGNGGKNATPTNLTCVKTAQTATVTWRNKSAEQATVSYGTQTSGQMPFIAEEKQAASPQDGGLYEHTVKLESLGEDSYIVAVTGFTDITTVCRGSSADSGRQGTRIDNQNAIINATPSPQPTSSSLGFDDVVVTPTQTPTPTPTVSTLLPLVEATSYYSTNTTSGIFDCVTNFASKTNSAGASYSGLGYVCANAWTQVNLSK